MKFKFISWKKEIENGYKVLSGAVVLVEGNKFVLDLNTTITDIENIIGSKQTALDIITYFDSHKKAFDNEKLEK